MRTQLLELANIVKALIAEVRIQDDKTKDNLLKLEEQAKNVFIELRDGTSG